jgi:hypothetical protein
VWVKLWVAVKSVSVVQPMMATNAGAHGFLGPLLLYVLVGSLIAPTGETSLHTFVNSLLTEALITFQHVFISTQ